MAAKDLGSGEFKRILTAIFTGKRDDCKGGQEVRIEKALVHKG
jgi:hypothetical protein